MAYWPRPLLGPAARNFSPLSDLFDGAAQLSYNASAAVTRSTPARGRADRGLPRPSATRQDRRPIGSAGRRLTLLRRRDSQRAALNRATWRESARCASAVGGPAGWL